MSSRTAFAIASAVAAIALASPTSGPAAADPPTTTSIVEPIIDRLQLADEVARSKWVTRGRIDDPVRERAVLDAAARTAPSGLDPDRVRMVVRDQIEASKTVQRALFAGWQADPRTAPRVDPDLTTVREQISELTSEIVTRLAARRNVPGDASCITDIASTTLRTITDRRLDAVQIAASIQAERSICP